MCCCIENFRIARKLPDEHSHKIQGLGGSTMSHRAVQAVETNALLGVVVRGLVDRFLQERQSFSAVATLREADGPLRSAGIRGGGTFRCCLGE